MVEGGNVYLPAGATFLGLEGMDISVQVREAGIFWVRCTSGVTGLDQACDLGRENRNGRLAPSRRDGEFLAMLDSIFEKTS